MKNVSFVSWRKGTRLFGQPSTSSAGCTLVLCPRAWYLGWCQSISRTGLRSPLPAASLQASLTRAALTWDFKVYVYSKWQFHRSPQLVKTLIFVDPGTGFPSQVWYCKMWSNVTARHTEASLKQPSLRPIRASTKESGSLDLFLDTTGMGGCMIPFT